MDREQLSFEDAFARLEAAVGRLEGTGLTVDDMVNQFEEGMKLAQLCYERLKAAEVRLTVLARETEAFDELLADDQSEDE